MARSDPKAKATKTKAAPEPVLDTGRIEQVAFGQLSVSPLNVRKHGGDIGPKDELTASIRAHGLLQPLVGYIAKSGPATVLVCAGQRRMKALEHVAGAETKVPVRIVDEDTAIEVSLAENLARKDMNPVDELDAFKALIDTGHYDANRIADRFGFDRRYVRRRLKMAVLHPDILVALLDGTIGVSSAEAYAASDDKDLQLRVFKAQSRPNIWNAHDPRNIVGEYAAAGIASDSGVGKFIGGVEAYVAEGGTVEREDAFAELFEAHGDAPKLADPDIVLKLYERAQAAAAPDAEAKAKDAFPAAARVEWCDASGKPPKQSKTSELALVREGWDGATGQYLDAERLKTLAREVANAGGAVVPLARVNLNGDVEIAGNMVLLGKDSLDQVRPKKEKSEREAYRAPTPEEQEAAKRERDIVEQACRMFVAALSDEDLGRRCRAAARIYGGGKSGVFDARIEMETADIAPFMDDAANEVDRGASALAEQREASLKILDHLAESPVGKWPAAVTISVDGDEIRITKGEDEDGPTLDCETDEEGWVSSDPAGTIEIIRDLVDDDSTVAVHMFDSLDAREAGKASAEGATDESVA